jgi:hypothetical protein
LKPYFVYPKLSLKELRSKLLPLVDEIIDLLASEKASSGYAVPFRNIVRRGLKRDLDKEDFVWACSELRSVYLMTICHSHSYQSMNNNPDVPNHIYSHPSWRVLEKLLEQIILLDHQDDTSLDEMVRS